MNTGLTLDQFKEIVEFAQIYHEYGRYYDNEERTAIKFLYPKWKNLHIKAIESIYSLKTPFRIYGVKLLFDGIGGYKPFYEIDSETPLYDRVLQYLKGGKE